MEGVRSATSPFWAQRRLVSFVGLAFAIFLSTAFVYLLKTGLGQWLEPLAAKSNLTRQLTIWIAVGADALIGAILYAGIVRAYKQLKTRRYPGTFVYCYKKNGKSAKSGRTQVIGSFVLDWNDEDGMVANGEVYHWATNGIDIQTKEEWRSLHVGSSNVNRKDVCYILFAISDTAHHDGHCVHGLLAFAHKDHLKGVIGGDSVYEGYMQSVSLDESGPFDHWKAYAERVSDPTSSDESRRKILQANGNNLIARLA